MPSLLVTKKMSPELAARVQAAVDGRRAPPGAKLAPRATSLLRIGATALIVVTCVWLGLSLHRAHRALEARRGELSERVRTEAAELGPDEHAALTRVLPWLPLFAGAYPGDLVADELRPSGAFASVLGRPTLYLRGPLSSFADRVDESAASSFKDAFVLCLHAPPTARTEPLLKAKARAAMSGRAEALLPAAGVERLHDVMIGLPFLSPDWDKKVGAARSREELGRLRRDFERAPIARAKAGARAKLLLVVVDEPNTEPGPTELDGERPHDVRVGLVDLGTRKVLLRLRRRVDPSWISPTARAEYASGIDSCALALDVHAAVANGGRVAAGE
ncbi:MAG: hypothetical protein HS104_29510 [Polyangiaceae bacterium]|nr:hypothetical protein [Polyangiaceae bacterium]MCE7892200.1 hypothetical protein [Sorangiineae bacterium PRO1]MCL4753077.1 hypothetical protein [Myxococcales bacterium]